jgi:hypothetical protein
MPNRRLYLLCFEESFEKVPLQEPGTGNARSITEINDLIDLCLKLPPNCKSIPYDRVITAL